MHESRVVWRSTGSSLSGFAMSSRKAIHMEMPAPADPPVEAIFVGSRFHSAALERRNWIARVLSSIGAGKVATLLRR